MNSSAPSERWPSSHCRRFKALRCSQCSAEPRLSQATTQWDAGLKVEALPCCCCFLAQVVDADITMQAGIDVNE